jgi:integrase
MTISVIKRGTKKDEVGVYIRYFHNNKTCRIPTRILVNPKDFQDVELKWVKAPGINFSTKNVLIREKKAAIEKFVLEYEQEHGECPSADTVMMFWDKASVAEVVVPISALWDRFLTDAQRKNKRPVGEARMKHYRVTIKRLLEFDPMFAFSKVDEDWFFSIRSWFKETHKNGRNTIIGHMSRLKPFFTWANDHGYAKIPTKLLREVDVKPAELDVIFNTDEEVRKLFAVDLSFDPELNNARNLYLLQCSFGTRHSDTDDEKWALTPDILTFKTQKQQKRVRTPISPEAQSLIDYYHKGGIPFPRLYNSDYNEKIKKVAAIAGLDRKVLIVMGRKKFKPGQVVPIHQLMSSHTARATFVCSMRRHGVHGESIADMLGVDVKTLKNYLAVEDTTLVKEAQAARERRGDMRVVHIDVKEKTA